MAFKKSITGRMSGKPPALFLGCFFSVFFLMGAFFLTVFFIVPALRIVKAADWVETPCVIKSSEVRSHSGDDSTTYSIEVTFEYEFRNGKYTSQRYSFVTGSSSGYDGKKKVVDRLRPGSEALCYVNPSEPSDAVLNRGFTGDIWLGLIPLAFVAVGAGGIVFAVRSARRRKAGITEGAREARPPRSVPSGPATLKPSMSPGCKLGVAIGIAAFWNGIVSIFVGMAISGWVKGAPEWFLSIFMIPFVLVGLGLLGWVLYQFLALFNPRPVLTVGSRAVPLGGFIELQWETAGSLHRVLSFKILLEGREEATYRRGTTTATDKNTFAEIVLAEGADGEGLRRGQASVQIPEHTMHSWSSSNNKIVWALRVKGEIPRWPDVNEEFPIEVLPR